MDVSELPCLWSQNLLSKTTLRERLVIVAANLGIVSNVISVDVQWLNRRVHFNCTSSVMSVVVVYPLPWPLLVGGVRCSRLWSTSQLLRPSGQQCSHFGGVCPQIQGRQCGAYVGAVEEMMCVVCVDVTEGA